jgi:glycosyltransferase involved in cell wall biosynthesis
MKISVVVCVKNEEERLRDCLKSVYSNDPDEVILVDGDSTDKTLDVAREFSDIIIYESKNSSLTRDRQIGLDLAKNEHIAMIDADHRLKPSDLESLLQDMKNFNFDIVQSGLISYKNHGYWDSAEEDSWAVTQNIPGKRNMVGTAPAIYNKKVFDFARFDDHITSTIDDTDFSYRLSKFPELRFGVGKTTIQQYHFADFKTYINKFLWYGKGDGEFCRKHPERTHYMFFHLLIRYPFLHSWKALKNARFRAIPFFMLQGYARFIGLVLYFLKLK